MKTTPEIVEELTEDKMVYNLHQIQHLLNGLMNGEVYDGTTLDRHKLLGYKLSILKILDIYNKEKNETS